MEEVFSSLNQVIKVSNNDFIDLQNYVKFLLEYNNKINLIGKSTIDNVWDRHIIDSLQVMKFIENKNVKVADLGSGAGLPGIVLSICGLKEIHLFEKSPRKCEFLEKAKKYSKNKIVVENKNLNEVKDNTFDLIVSRALADLNSLLFFSEKLLKNNGQLIFLKGKKIYEEIKEAEKYWKFDYELFNSITSIEGKIIKINSFRKK